MGKQNLWEEETTRVWGEPRDWYGLPQVPSGVPDNAVVRIVFATQGSSDFEGRVYRASHTPWVYVRSYVVHLHTDWVDWDGTGVLPNSIPKHGMELVTRGGSYLRIHANCEQETTASRYLLRGFKHTGEIPDTVMFRLFDPTKDKEPIERAMALLAKSDANTPFPPLPEIPNIDEAEALDRSHKIRGLLRSYADTAKLGMDVPGYETLAAVLQRAYDQAAKGKGKERHANGEPFDEQVMQDGAKRFGVGGLLFQAYKKSEESQRLPQDRAIVELLGAINYLAGAVIALEKKSP